MKLHKWQLTVKINKIALEDDEDFPGSFIGIDLSDPGVHLLVNKQIANAINIHVLGLTLPADGTLKQFMVPVTVSIGHLNRQALAACLLVADYTALTLQVSAYVIDPEHGLEIQEILDDFVKFYGEA